MGRLKRLGLGRRAAIPLKARHIRTCHIAHCTNLSQGEIHSNGSGYSTHTRSPVFITIRSAALPSFTNTSSKPLLLINAAGWLEWPSL